MKNDDLLSKYEVESFSDEEPEENDLIEKYGVEEPKEKTNEFLNAFSKILKQAKEAPSEIAEELKDLIPGTLDIAKTVFTQSPATTIEDLVAGWAKGLRGTANIPSEGVGKEPYFSPTEWEKSVLARTESGHQRLQGLASFISNQIGARNPYAMAGRGALWAVGQKENPFVAGILSGIPEAAKKIPRTVQEIVPKAKELSGNLTDKFLNLIGKENLEEIAQNVVGKESKLPGSKSWKEWREKNISPMPYTTLTVPQIMANLEAAEGLQIPIGPIFEDPALAKQFSNELAMIEGSPAQKIMMNTARQITDEGDTILRHLVSKATPQQMSHVGETIIKEVRELGSEIEQTKKQKYDVVDKLAEKEGVSTSRSNFRKFAKNRLADIEADKDLASQVDPQVKKSLKEAATESKHENFSIKKTNILKGEFGALARDARAANNTKLANVYESMNKYLKEDIDTAIKESGNSELKNLYEDAEGYFKNEWIPFEDADIKKYTQGKGDPDMLLQSFIKISKLSDRSRLLKKITDKLDPNTRNIFAHQYLSNAIDENGRINPLKARTLWNSLGEGQREAMFGNYVPEMNRYMKKVSLSSDALNMMYNPQTGAKLAPMIKKLELAASAGAGGLAGLGISHNPLISALVGTITPLAAKKIASKHHGYLVNRHVSEPYRRKVAEQKIKEIQSKNQKLPRHLRLLNESLERARTENINDYLDLRK
jgi:hypothetical protein